MKSANQSRPDRPSSRRGVTLLEVTVAVLLVGLLLVPALRLLLSSTSSSLAHGERAVGLVLAEQLMAEILLAHYEEPVDPPNFGRESSESVGDRTNWDDVDDYDGWSSSPPESKDGSNIPNRSNWQRAVAITFVDPDDLSSEESIDLGVKRIEITVSRGGVVRAELFGYRTDNVGSGP